MNSASEKATYKKNLGRTSIGEIDVGYPYTYWDAGLTAKHDRYSLDVRYVGTGLYGRDCALTFGGTHWCQAGAVAIVSYAVGP